MADSVRTFVAVEVDEPVRQQVARVQAAFRSVAQGAKWVDPALCHVTLKFLGAVPAERLPEVAEGCRRAAAGAQPFELMFRGVGAFPRWRGARVLWMGLADGQAQLAALQVLVEGQMSHVGFPPEGRPFSPHLTLARFKQPPPRGIEEVAVPFHDERFGRLRVTEMRLMRSDLRRTGPVYTPLEIMPLG